MAEDTPTHSASKMSPKESSFSGISLITIFAGNHSQRGRYSETIPVASENLIIISHGNGAR